MTLKENREKIMGCASEIIISCDNCDVENVSISSSKAEIGHYDRNVRFVEHGFPAM